MVLAQLGANGREEYGGWLPDVDMISANSTVDSCPQILVQIQLTLADDMVWSEWVDEIAFVRPSQVGLTQLSGSLMRIALYFGMALGKGWASSLL